MANFSEYLHGVRVFEEAAVTTLAVEARTGVIGLIGVSPFGDKEKLVLLRRPEDAGIFYTKSNADIDKLINAIDDEVAAKTKLKTATDEAIKNATGAAKTALQEKAKVLDGEIKALGEGKKTLQSEKDKESLPNTIEDSLRAIYAQGKPLVIVYNVGLADAAVAPPVAAGNGGAGGTETPDNEPATPVRTPGGRRRGNVSSNAASEPVTERLIDVTPYVKKIAGEETQRTGIYKFIDAEESFGFNPKILIAPEFSHEDTVIESLRKVSASLRGIAVIDLNDDNVSEAIATTRTMTTARIYPTYPRVKSLFSEESKPMSPFVAGHIARIDSEFGYWVSPSNRTLQGVKGLNKVISWSPEDPNSEVNALNEAGIATIIRRDGYRLFGARTVGKGNPVDTENRYLNVRRTSDVLNETLSRIAFESIDQNIGNAFILKVEGDMNAYLREAKRRGAIINGTCKAREEDNPSENLRQGIVVFTVEYTPSYVAEQIKIVSRITDKFLSEIFG